MAAGTILRRGDIEALRPAPANAIFPYDLNRVVGKKLLVDVENGEELTWEKIGE
jgi:sialic acid synthase SpsE